MSVILPREAALRAIRAGMSVVAVQGTRRCRKTMQALDEAYLERTMPQDPPRQPEDAVIATSVRALLRARCVLCGARKRCKAPLP